MALSEYVTGIQHVGIPTNDMKATLAFYEALGFHLAYRTVNGSERVCFLQLGNLCIETYENGNAALKAGAVDHIAIDVMDIEASYRAVQAMGCDFLGEGISYLPFWERGIRYFVILGPNREKIEFCQIL